MRKHISLILIAAAIFSLTSCNTIGVLVRDNIGTESSVTTPTTKPTQTQETTPAPTDPQSQNAVQEYWNRTWYGGIFLTEKTGKYELFTDTDAYIFFDLDAKGEGSLILYLYGGEKPFAVIDGFVRSETFFSNSGYVLDCAIGSAEFNVNVTYDYDDQISIQWQDYTDEDGDSFEYELCFKPWGTDWEEQKEYSLALFPPGYELYLERLENGKGPLYDAAGPLQVIDTPLLPSHGNTIDDDDDDINPTPGGMDVVHFDGFDMYYSLNDFELGDGQYVYLGNDDIYITIYEFVSYEAIELEIMLLEAKENHVVSETTIAGFDTVVYEYVDLWGDHCVDYVVYFDDWHSDSCGVHISAWSVTGEALQMDAFIALINSITPTA